LLIRLCVSDELVPVVLQRMAKHEVLSIPIMENGKLKGFFFFFFLFFCVFSFVVSQQTKRCIYYCCRLVESAVIRPLFCALVLASGSFWFLDAVWACVFVCFALCLFVEVSFFASLVLPEAAKLGRVLFLFDSDKEDRKVLTCFRKTGLFDVLDYVALVFASEQDIPTMPVSRARNASHHDVCLTVSPADGLFTLAEIFSRGVHRACVVENSVVIGVVKYFLKSCWIMFYVLLCIRNVFHVGAGFSV
jgi:hypothetical protein